MNSAFLNPSTEMSQSDVSTEKAGHAITAATLSNPNRLHQRRRRSTPSAPTGLLMHSRGAATAAGTV